MNPHRRICEARVSLDDPGDRQAPSSRVVPIPISAKRKTIACSIRRMQTSAEFHQPLKAPNAPTASPTDVNDK